MVITRTQRVIPTAVDLCLVCPPGQRERQSRLQRAGPAWKSGVGGGRSSAAAKAPALCGCCPEGPAGMMDFPGRSCPRLEGAWDPAFPGMGGGGPLGLGPLADSRISPASHCPSGEAPRWLRLGGPSPEVRTGRGPGVGPGPLLGSEAPLTVNPLGEGVGDERRSHWERGQEPAGWRGPEGCRCRPGGPTGVTRTPLTLAQSWTARRGEKAVPHVVGGSLSGGGSVRSRCHPGPPEPMRRGFLPVTPGRLRMGHFHPGSSKDLVLVEGPEKGGLVEG